MVWKQSTGEADGRPATADEPQPAGINSHLHADRQECDDESSCFRTPRFHTARLFARSHQAQVDRPGQHGNYFWRVPDRDSAHYSDL